MFHVFSPRADSLAGGHTLCFKTIMLQIFHKKSRAGFTLIELLVVIAIIGILATIVLVSLNSARQKARNTRRVSDLRQIQLGSEIYYDKNGSYAASIAAIVTDGAMASEPKDPSTDASYFYCTGGGGYSVGALLENATDAGTNKLLQSSTSSPLCNPNSWANCGTTDTGRYCVSP